MAHYFRFLVAAFTLTALVGAGCQTTTEMTIDTQNEESTTNTEETQESNSLFEGSLTGALALGQDMTCTWTDDEGSGIAYVTNGQFATTITTPERTGRMVVQEECTHTWEVGATEGIKLCNLEEMAQEMADSLPEGMTMPTQETAAQTEIDAEVYCTAGIEDENAFTIPENITFIDPFAALNFSL